MHANIPSVKLARLPLAIGDATLETYVGGDEKVIGGGETDGSCC
jgi:hypothetical protein